MQKRILRKLIACLLAAALVFPAGGTVWADNGDFHAGGFILQEIEPGVPGGNLKITGYDGAGGAVAVPGSYEVSSAACNVTLIAAGALQGVTTITEITIPSSVSGIEAGAFTGCTALARAYFTGARPSFGAAAFDGSVTLYYHVSQHESWQGFSDYPTQEYCRLTLDRKDGSAPAATKADVTGGLIAEPAAPERTGYAFAGWHEDEACESDWDFATSTVTQDLTLFAAWAGNAYTVTFDAQGGTVDPGTKPVTYGAAYGALPTPSKTNYTFGGWYLDSGFTGAAVTEATDVSTAADHTLYAKWTGNAYTVTFDAQGGTVDPGTKTVTYGAAYGALPTPSKTNYTFGGWYADSGCTGTAVTEATVVTTTADHTLYAKWTGNAYTVTFDAQGGTVDPGTKEVTYAAAYGTLPTPTLTGYAFGSWYADSGCTGTAVTEATVVTTAADHTLYAKWTANTYTVTFDAQGGTVDPGTKPVTYGAAYGTLPTPSKTNYAFGGWYLDGGCTGSAITEATVVSTAADHTLYAKWTCDYDYTLADGGITITGYHGAGGEITVPAAFDGYPVVAVGASAFNGNATITDAALPAGLKTIGIGAFKNCTGLLGMIIPDGTTTVGDEAFSGCVSLQGVQIPGSVTAIGSKAFYQCDSLLVVEIPGSVQTVSAMAFYGCGHLYCAILDEGITTIAGEAFAYCEAMSSVQLPESLTGIQSCAFKGCASLESVVIPAGVTAIGSGAFSVCGSLSAVSIPAGVNEIGDEVFQLCGGLRTATFYEAMPTMGARIFDATHTEFKLYYPVSHADSWAGYTDAPTQAYCMLTLYTNNGSGPETVQANVTGGKLEQPADPLLTNYQLEGWYKEESLTNRWVFAEDTATGDMALYAKWVGSPRTVAFDSRGGSDVPSKTTPYNSTVGAPDAPTRPGYDFDGWHKENNCETDWVFTTDIVTADITLYAAWAPASYTVTFEPQGGTVGTATKTVMYTHAYGTLPTPTKSGYAFSGWYPDSGCTGALVDEATAVSTTADHTLYARWTPKDYTVTFDLQGGDAIDPTTKTVTFTAAYGTLPKPSRTGYAFGGWYANSGCAGTSVTDATTVATAGDHSLYAKWTPNAYTVTFEPQGGDALDPATKTVTFAAAYGNLPGPSKTGHTFAGWYADSGCAGSQVTATTTVSTAADHLLYAKWTINTYTVAFNAQGGSAVGNKSALYNTTVAAPAAPTRTGYTFGKWYKDSGCTQAWDFSVDKVTGDVTLYAGWTANTYTVTFNPQSGDVSPTTMTVTYDAAYGTLPEPSRSGYAFSNWFMNSGCTGSAITDTTKVATAGNHTLYAGWASTIPAGVKAQAATYTSIRISWNAVLKAKGYNVFRYTPSSNNYKYLGSTDTTNYTESDLATGKTYYYVVRSYQTFWSNETMQFIYSDYSSKVSAKPMPAAPGSVKAASASYSSIKVSWGAVAGATKYELWSSTSASGKYKKLTTTSSRSYTNKSLTTGKAYYYKVRAYHTEGSTKIYGGWSAVVNAKPTLGTPASLKAARASATSIKLTWKAVSGRTKYEIWRCDTSASGTYKLIGTTTSTSYTNTKLTTGKTYYYKVRAYRTVSGKKVYGAYGSVVSGKP